MTLSIQVNLQGFTLSEVRRRIRSHPRSLERRLKNRPEPAAVLVPMGAEVAEIVNC
jgi:hypothetical protein